MFFEIYLQSSMRSAFDGAVEPAAQVSIPTFELSYSRLYTRVSPLLSTVQNMYMNNKFAADRLLVAGIQMLHLQHNFLTGMEISPPAAIPGSSSLCLQYNCMVPPVKTPCPLKAGKQKSRPAVQCVQWWG